MTRKDYIRLARALAKSAPSQTCLAKAERGDNLEAGYVVAWRYATIDIASALAADNPRFNRDKFIAACNHAEN